jgi:hypothetical protein
VTPPEETGGNGEYKLRPKSQSRTPTAQVIRLSELCIAFLARIVSLGIVADGAVVVMLASRAPARQWLLSAYSQLWLLGVIVLLVCVAIAIAVPVMNDLIQPFGGAAGPGT